MGKGKLNLSIRTDLLELAKNSGLNLSQEFENFIATRLSVDLGHNDNIDYDLEIAKLKQQITILENRAKSKESLEELDKRKIELTDRVLNNIKEFSKDIKEEIPNRVNGFIYLYNNAFGKRLSKEEALKILNDRAKDRGLFSVIL